MQKFIIEHLSSITTVYDSEISQKLEIEYEARLEKHKPSCPATGNGKVPGNSHL